MYDSRGKMKDMKLDYAPLSQAVTMRERWQTGWGKGVLVCFMLIIAALLGSAIMYGLRGVHSLTVAPLVFAGLCVVIAVAAYVQAARQIRLGQFAAKNGIIYKRNVPYDDRPGVFFGVGHSKSFAESFSFLSPTMEIGNYSYTTGSGKSRQTHLIGYVQLALPRRLPHMVLDSRKNNFFGRMSNIPYGFSSDQKLSLEGNFDEYFTLFAPATYKRDALYVFTPDVMQLLMTSVPGFDIEIIDDTLYLYSEAAFELTKQSQLEPLIQVAAALSAKFSRQTDYYADEHVGDRSQNVIAAPGARLKTGYRPLLIVVFIIVLICSMIFATR